MRHVILMLLLAQPLLAAQPMAKKHRAIETGQAVVQEALEKEFAGKKWHNGPQQVETPELAQLQAGRRFWLIWSSPPLPPGAQGGQIEEAYQKALQDFHKNYVQHAVIALDAVDKPTRVDVLALKWPHPKNEADRKKIAAAALSLLVGERMAPIAVRPEQLKADKQNPLILQGEFGQARATVVFTEAGKIQALNWQSLAPLPP